MDKINELLDKGAIPRMTQEIYYICSSDGSKVVNIDLTLDRFRDKLKKIEWMGVKHDNK
jgi:hypothetical protein